MAQATSGWKSQSGFIWAVLGSVVGFANVLSFSAQCYRNGGGAFLIPYFIAYLCLGLPMLLLEGVIGQKFSMPLVTAYGKKAPSLGKYIGWIAIISCLTIGSFYIVLTAYSALYTYFGAVGAIPEDTSYFFKYEFLRSTSSILEMGSFSFPIFSTVLLIGLFVWWTMVRDISKGVEAVCSMVMPLMTVLVVLFAVVSTFLPGAFDGIIRFLKPDFSKLLDISLWRDVFGQLFFSLSLGLGIITGYSQYNGKTFELRKSMTLVAIGDFAISFIAGWVVFASIGYMSYTSGVPFQEMIKSDSSFEIGFIIFPKILHTFSGIWRPLLSVVFFFCVFIAGITGVFSIVESVTGNVEREFNIERKKAVTIVLGIITLLSAVFCLGNGQHIIGELSSMVLGLTMILSAFVELIVFLYFTPEIRDDEIWFRSGKRRIGFYAIKYIVPILLVSILAGGIAVDVTQLGIGFLVRWVWFASATIAAYTLMRSAAVSHRLTRQFA